jgi:hypothetical protein
MNEQTNELMWSVRHVSVARDRACPISGASTAGLTGWQVFRWLTPLAPDVAATNAPTLSKLAAELNAIGGEPSETERTCAIISPKLARNGACPGCLARPDGDPHRWTNVSWRGDFEVGFGDTAEERCNVLCPDCEAARGLALLPAVLDRHYGAARPLRPVPPPPAPPTVEELRQRAEDARHEHVVDALAVAMFPATASRGDARRKAAQVVKALEGLFAAAPLADVPGADVGDGK